MRPYERHVQAQKIGTFTVAVPYPLCMLLIRMQKQ